MKLTCDLCGGALQMNMGAKDAACKNCGLCYSLEVLREKLGVGAAPQPKKEVVPEQPVVPNIPVVTPVVQQTVVEQPVAPAAEQFIMRVNSLVDGCLTGTVQQGCIGVGEHVYINGDYSKPYRVYRFDHDIDTTHVSAGQYAKLDLYPSNKSAMKQANVVTGDSAPVANAYRFPGSVEDYFEDLLRKNFGEYTLQKQVECPGIKIPVSFMLLQNNRPVVAIFIFDSSDARSRYQAQKAEKIFGSAVIGCTHFFKEYRNDAPYVIDRIRAAMG